MVLRSNVGFPLKFVSYSYNTASYVVNSTDTVNIRCRQYFKIVSKIPFI